MDQGNNPSGKASAHWKNLGDKNRSSPRQNRNSASGFGGSSGNQHKPTREQGFVISLKDNFGFVKSPERENDVFFHYMELLDYSPDDLKINDELEFSVRQGKGGRYHACEVRILPKGTITLDKVVDSTVCFGVVTHDFRKPKFDARGDRAATDNFNGRIHRISKTYTTNEIAQIYDTYVGKRAPRIGETDNDSFVPFGERGLASYVGKIVNPEEQVSKRNDELETRPMKLKPLRVRAGDIVQFQLAEEKSTGIKHAFHMEMYKTHTEYYTEAVTKSLENLGESDRFQGVVKALGASIVSDSTKESVKTVSSKTGGIIQCAEKYNQLSFNFQELPEENRPEVQSSSKSSSSRGNWRNSTSNNAFGAQDWRKSEEAETKKKVHVGMSVEFNVVPDPRNPSSFVAVRLKVLAPNTVVLEEVIAKGARGIVLSKQGESGVIQLDKPIEVESNNVTTVNYQATDVITPGPKPLKGDIIACDVIKSKLNKSVFAIHVYLAVPNEERSRTIDADPLTSALGRLCRETGVVNTLRESFGFITCMDRDGEIFFPYNEVVATPLTKELALANPDSKKLDRLHNDPPFQLGEEVSFTVAEGNGGGKRKLIASRVLKIPRGSTTKEVTIASRVEGVVRSVSKGKKQENEYGIVEFEATKFVVPMLFEQLKRVKDGAVERVEISSIKPFKSSNNRIVSTPKIVEKEDRVVISLLPNEQKFVKEYCKMLKLNCENNKEKGRMATMIVRKLDETAPNAETNEESTAEELVSSNSDAPKENTTSTDENANEVEPTAQANSEKKDIPEEPLILDGNCSSVKFTGNAFRSGKLPKKITVGDRIVFDLTVDKTTLSYVIRGIKPFDSKVKQERESDALEAKAQIGVVACIKDEGFGFIQSAAKPLRVFFHLSECEDPAYRQSIKEGDDVEFVTKGSKKGKSAFNIKKVEQGLAVCDVIESTERVTGFVTSEPKQLSSLVSTMKLDHIRAVKIAAAQNPVGALGQIMIGDSFDEINPTKDEVDWRRETELRSKVRDFMKQSDVEALHLQLSSIAEVKCVKKVVRKESIFAFPSTTCVETGLVLAKTKKAYNDFINPMDKEAATPSETTEGVAETEKNVNETEVQSDPVATKDETVVHKGPYCFSLCDVFDEASEWIPFVGDHVEFTVATNKSTGNRRAVDIKVLKSIAKHQVGVIDGAPHGGRFGFIRPLVAGEASQAIYGKQDNVDEAFKPGSGGRDGTVKFDVSQIIGVARLNDGDEVEYLLVVDHKTKVAKAVRVKLIKRSETNPEKENSSRKVVNKALMEKLKTTQEANATPRFVQAKGPDGTLGFAPGRGRGEISRKNSATLRADAKEFTPAFDTTPINPVMVPMHAPMQMPVMGIPMPMQGIPPAMHYMPDTVDSSGQHVPHDVEE